MTTATVTTKGQITIPLEVRIAMQVDAGDRVEFVELEPGKFLFAVVNRSVTELKGMFGQRAKSAPSVSIEDMNKAIAARGASAA
jgi:antitoxin PrlF